MATTTAEKNANILFDGGQKLTFDWESSTGGIASKTSDYEFNGRVETVVFINDTGARVPTTAYDVTVTDEDGEDILNGLGANVSSTGTRFYKQRKDGLGMVVYSKLSLSISGAGNTKGGKVVLFLTTN